MIKHSYTHTFTNVIGPEVTPRTLRMPAPKAWPGLAWSRGSERLPGGGDRTAHSEEGPGVEDNVSCRGHGPTKPWGSEAAALKASAVGPEAGAQIRLQGSILRP